MVGNGKVEGPSMRWLAPFMMNRVPVPQRAEPADDEPLRPVVVEDVARLERRRVVRVVVVGVLPHLDQRGGHQRLEEHHPRLPGQRMEHRGVCGHGHVGLLLGVGVR